MDGKIDEIGVLVEKMTEFFVNYSIPYPQRDVHMVEKA